MPGKTKTSITLSEDVLAAVDRLVKPGQSRSSVIEHAVREFLRNRARARAHARELAGLNRVAERLNREAEDVRAYQAPWVDE